MDELLQRTAEIFATAADKRGPAPDLKGCWRDNVFVERLWKTKKYEEIYLHAYNTVSDAPAGIAKHFMFYNQRRPHTQHGGETPDALYFGNLEMNKAA